MIFLTVGTQFPFDRLLKAVDDAFEQGLLTEDVCAQAGESSYKPRNFEAVASMQKHEFDIHLTKASAVIGHAGIGTITATLEQEKPLLVMPRLKQFGEVVNDHQVGIARRFEQAGLLIAAYKADELAGCIKLLKTFKPQKRQCAADAVVERISRFLQDAKYTNTVGVLK
jgi:beta-1,4-N-acetylglucosaminyltransferase